MRTTFIFLVSFWLFCFAALVFGAPMNQAVAQGSGIEFGDQLGGYPQFGEWITTAKGLEIPLPLSIMTASPIHEIVRFWPSGKIIVFDDNGNIIAIRLPEGTIVRDLNYPKSLLRHQLMKAQLIWDDQYVKKGAL